MCHAVADCACAGPGGMATLVTHPPDVVRARLQLYRASQMSKGAQLATLPALRMADIVRQEGLLALWSGITPRLARRTLQQAMTWTLFEYIYQGRVV